MISLTISVTDNKNKSYRKIKKYQSVPEKESKMKKPVWGAEFAAGLSWQVLLHLGEAAADFFDGVMVSNAHAETVTKTTAPRRIICFFINTSLKDRTKVEGKCYTWNTYLCEFLLHAIGYAYKYLRILLFLPLKRLLYEWEISATYCKWTGWN